MPAADPLCGEHMAINTHTTGDDRNFFAAIITLRHHNHYPVTP
jgi:hypothetical protein